MFSCKDMSISNSFHGTAFALEATSLIFNYFFHRLYTHTHTHTHIYIYTLSYHFGMVPAFS